ncbi:MAG: DUF2125 domain-containing protein [Devosia sp.]|nr:DUF2125 domain-containing protein [Devosia sp.]
MRKIVALGVVVLVVVALWAGAWFWAAGELHRQVALLGEADGETAPRLTCAPFEVGGFPFRFDLECRDGVLVDQDRTYRIAGVRASVLVYSPSHVIFSAASPLTLANAFTGSESRIDFVGLEGSARLVAADPIRGLTGEGWRIARISVEADGIAWNETIVGDLLQLEAGHVEAHLVDMTELHDRTAGTAALAGFARAEGLTVPAFRIGEGNASLEVELTGLPDDLRVLAADPDPVRNWQRRNGVFRLVRFAGDQPAPEETFEISGEARLGATGLLDAEVTYRQKRVLDRLEAFMAPLQLAAIKGKPEADGSSGNTLTIVEGRMRLLTLDLLEIDPLF